MSVPNGREAAAPNTDWTAPLMQPGKPPPRHGEIARYRSSDGYNDTFAMQWKRFRDIQLDAVNNTQITAQRFATTGWPLGELRGQTVLEAGCGAGRFTRIMAEAGANLVTFDYSSAVDVNASNNGHFPNIRFAQADILDLPFKDGAFDRVFCYGVLQHTPDPKAAFLALARKLKPGGRIAIDVYKKDWQIRPWKSKRLWRWATTRMKPERLLAFLDWFIPKWLPLDTAIKRIPYAGNYLGSVIPCFNYWYQPLSPELKVQWAIMDTFDALAPTYDIPATLAEVRTWCAEAGLRDVSVAPGGNGIVASGRAPAAV